MADLLLIRKTLLEVIKEYSSGGDGVFQQRPILHEVVDRLKSQITLDRDAECSILTTWGDLFHERYLSWGCDIYNPDPPFIHLTEKGKNSFENLSRDPANPSGCSPRPRRDSRRLHRIRKKRENELC